MYSTTRESWHSASDCCSRKYSSSSPSPPLLFCQTQSGWDSGPAPRTSWTRPSQCCTPEARKRDSKEDSCLKGLISYRTGLSPSSWSGVTHVEGFLCPHIPNPNPPMPWGASYQAVHLGKLSIQMIFGENKWRWINLIYLVSGEAIYRLVIFLFPWSHSSTAPDIKIMISWSSQQSHCQ